MRLVRLSVQRYRSIIETERFGLGDFTVLVGPNNEGKSNILQALVTSMSALAGSPSRGRTGTSRRRRGERFREGYNWDRDFPRSLQSTQPTGTTLFNVDFELTPEEIDEFEQAVGSRLNGILPVSLAFGTDNQYTFSVRKQRHSRALSARKTEIEDFIAGKIHLQYIPAARTNEAALEVVDDMIEREFGRAEDSDEYRDALQHIKDLQQPIIEHLEETICESLQQILPDVRSVTLDIPEERLRMPVRSRVLVDDGTLTDLEFKGDGVQSLAALSLIQHHSQDGVRGRELILAIEEPEAHLHPGAIHEIAEVLRTTAARQQVVISTHSPLLVNRFDLGSNLLVKQTKARAAKSVMELREALGVRISDNLENADVILVVEGSEDERALRSVLSAKSSRLRTTLSSGQPAIQALFGGAKLPYVLAQLKTSMCRVQTFLDDDAAGREAAAKARDEGLLDIADEMFAQLPDVGESELEDFYITAVYATAFEETFGVRVDQFDAIPRGRGKWSARMRLLFVNQGKRWDDDVEQMAKAAVSASVVDNPLESIRPEGEPVIAALVTELERRFQ